MLTACRPDSGRETITLERLLIGCCFLICHELIFTKSWTQTVIAGLLRRVAGDSAVSF